jgi:CDP-alcohol phosphatidyltransferase
MTEMSMETTEAMSEFQKINECAKRPTDIWTNYLYYPFSLRLVYIIRNTRITPNALTLTALCLVLIGCAFYATGARAETVLGLILIQISYVFDCADGQLARYRKQYSPIGGWLDQTADRIKEFVLYFSLAYGYTRFHPGNTRIWMWAMTALFVLYLLEYFEQIDMIRVKGIAPKLLTANGVPLNAEEAEKMRREAQGEAGNSPDASAPGAGAQDADTFRRIQRMRSFIPFRGFIIGEQYVAMLVFIAFGAIYPFFVFVTIISLLMTIYRPVINFVKYRRQVAVAGGSQNNE